MEWGNEKYEEEGWTSDQLDYVPSPTKGLKGSWTGHWPTKKEKSDKQQIIG